MENKLIITQIPLQQFKEIIKGCIREEMDKPNLKTADEDTLIKTTEVIKLLNISKVTLYKWRKKKIIPYHQIGTRIYFKKNEVLQSVKAPREK